MITIITVKNTDDKAAIADFFKSISAQHSGEFAYEVISQNYECEIPNRVNKPNADSKISITLPVNCVVLGNSWDKYIGYALENGIPQGGVGKTPPTWESCVIRWMNLMDRGHSGLFPELSVTFPLVTE